MSKPLTQQRLKEVLNYDKETGYFTRLVKSGPSVKVGERAGYKHTDKNGKSYIRISVDGKKYAAHRLVFLYVDGKFPDDQVDHKNGCGIDNWWTNLKQATNADNGKNQKLPKDNTTGICGVYFYKNKTLFQVQITADGKKIHLGYTSDFFEACCLRKAAQLKYGFSKNHGLSRPL